MDTGVEWQNFTAIKEVLAIFYHILGIGPRNFKFIREYTVN